jgi:ABC-type histidine transport system ATPase subunit
MTAINQGNFSIVTVLLKFANDVFSKLKILHDYVIGETPKPHALLSFAISFTVRRIASSPYLGKRCALILRF